MIASAKFHIVVLLGLFVGNLNGQTQNPSNSSHIKPVTNSFYETNGFTGENITSGPILIIDKKTLFIPNLHYDSESKDTRFWVGTGEPSQNGTLVPDETNFTGPLKTYSGRNIYLQLPANLTTDKIDYIALWSTEKKTDLEHVVLYQNATEARQNVPEALGYHNKTVDNKAIHRIPYCCGLNQIFNGTCISQSEDLRATFKVFESNETHIDPDKNLTDVELVPYEYIVTCPTNFYRVAMEPESILGLIYNSSLIYFYDSTDHGILSDGSYCVLFYNTTEKPKVAYCVALETAEASVPYLYLPFLVISTICFFACAVVYIFILKAKDVHRKCFIGYSISMVVTFITLIFLQNINTACNFIGSIFMFGMICSFVWLACLCLDLICVVKKPSRCPEDSTRIYLYLAFSMVIPAIILGCSVMKDGIPDVPSSFVKRYSQNNGCSFGEVNKEVFFVPIGLLISVSVIGLAYTSYIISSHKEEDYEWIHNRPRFKFMLRSCFLVWITTFIWLIEAIIDSENMQIAIKFAIDLIEALQGIFVLIIFVLHKYTRKEINRIIYKKKILEEQQQRYQQLLTTLGQQNTAAGDNESGGKTS